jgi:hypothetical protein
MHIHSSRLPLENFSIWLTHSFRRWKIKFNFLALWGLENVIHLEYKSHAISPLAAWVRISFIIYSGTFQVFCIQNRVNEIKIHKQGIEECLCEREMIQWIIFMNQNSLFSCINLIKLFSLYIFCCFRYFDVSINCIDINTLYVNAFPEY